MAVAYFCFKKYMVSHNQCLISCIVTNIQVFRAGNLKHPVNCSLPQSNPFNPFPRTRESCPNSGRHVCVADGVAGDPGLGRPRRRPLQPPPVRPPHCSASGHQEV